MYLQWTPTCLSSILLKCFNFDNNFNLISTGFNVRYNLKGFPSFSSPTVSVKCWKLYKITPVLVQSPWTSSSKGFTMYNMKINDFFLPLNTLNIWQQVSGNMKLVFTLEHLYVCLTGQLLLVQLYLFFINNGIQWKTDPVRQSSDLVQVMSGSISDRKQKHSFYTALLLLSGQTKHILVLN